MEAEKPRIQVRRRSRILEPVILIALAALAVLMLVTFVLISEFNHVTLDLQKRTAVQGYQNRFSEYANAVEPRIAWDDAVKNADNLVDLDWIDKNLAGYLFATSSIQKLFVLGDTDNVFYASDHGRRAPLDSYASFALSVRDVLPGIRAREALRPPINRHPRNWALATQPIQAANIALVNGRVFIVIASLMQPDFGTVMPDTPRSPVVVTALPITPTVLLRMGIGRQVQDLQIIPSSRPPLGLNSIPLTDARGQTLASLAWSPNLPETSLLGQLLMPVALIVLVFAAITWRLVSRSTSIANDLIASEAQARHLAFHDTLTQLPNRALAFDRLRNMLAVARRRHSQIAVMCLDLDRFKDVNDTLGHPSGDELIQGVAERLRGVCRETDTVARMGGDEFLIIQPGTSAAGASHLAERILVAFKEPFELKYGMVEIGCSVGVTLIVNPEMDPPEAVRQADLALYASKENGRTRVTFFEPEMDAALRMRRALETDLRKALADGSLAMAYQPQTDEHGVVDSVEALVRWNHPVKGAISPTIFVPLAEESGLILDLGEFVFRRVFEETSDWTNLRVAINVSALQLRSQNFMSMVTRLVAEFRIDASRYEIEITETALLGDDTTTRDNVTVLKQEGFTIALDDFGTGYSSLSSLQRFAVDKIKIDRSFVRNLESDDREAEALVDAIVKLGRAMGLDVIAEGVETARQRERLVLCGCTHFQGYLLGRPVSAQDLLALVD
jgi:diguanylate cyclase (GGDEF)-like protein